MMGKMLNVRSDTYQILLLKYYFAVGIKLHTDDYVSVSLLVCDSAHSCCRWPV